MRILLLLRANICTNMYLLQYEVPLQNNNISVSKYLINNYFFYLIKYSQKSLYIYILHMSYYFYLLTLAIFIIITLIKNIIIIKIVLFPAMKSSEIIHKKV